MRETMMMAASTQRGRGWKKGPRYSTTDSSIRADTRLASSDLIIIYLDFFFFCTIFNTASSDAPQIPYCVGGCWDRTQDSCDYTALAVRRSNHSAIDLIHNRLDLIH